MPRAFSVIAIAVSFIAVILPLHAQEFVVATADGPISFPTGGEGAPLITSAATSPADYLNSLYAWLLGFVGISAMFAFVYGGVIYMFSGTNITQASQATRWITNGVYGLVLAATSVLLLSTINPDLVGGFDLSRIIGG